ncbi:MAG: hypothetical protein DRP57_12160 [Spirochaetes bacterium]|nr:MAG: hypothetical protein DRP57_12160 [Spirochaetota bacterium]
MEAVGTKILNQFKVMLLVAIITLIGQRIGYDISIGKAVPGMLLIMLIGMVALIIKDFTPKLKFPAFAWASLIALLLTMPFVPTSEFVLSYTKDVSFLGTTTPILAFAGISVGMKVAKLKQLSWKLLVVAVFVFIGTFFGSAIIAQIVLKIQGLI